MRTPATRVLRNSVFMSQDPWTSSDEWNDVFELLYSSEIEHQRKGLARVSRFDFNLSLSFCISCSLGGNLEGTWSSSCAVRGDGGYSALLGPRRGVCEMARLQRTRVATNVCHGSYKVRLGL